MAVASQIVTSLLQGNQRAVAKAITHVEDGTSEAEKITALLYPHTGKAQVIGITGSGGVGKSTLIEKLVRELRRGGKTVGVIAVDPTSPFSGGAFLGDRIRMQDLSTDEGVFIRSMATRNNPGGLARATMDTVRILDASGKDIVLIETVGAGQSEVDIIKIAPTVVVVLAPGFGDAIQTIKAGIMEIGDIFVINKADRESADKAVINIRAMLQLGTQRGKWVPPIVKTTATTGAGVSELLEKIGEHREYLSKGEASQRQRRIVREELEEAIKRKTAEHILNALQKEGELDNLISKLLSKEIDPISAAEEALNRILTRSKRR
ncbi:methylmalonyl Co-A mutase-associated GTPase MeaB [Candidatus Bathyarchaeota archaeon]|nr:methylmalonyl Co-A mutase-associated GTPase MeaB [Candidatus Bathyarchaeota archaeon]